MNPPVTLVIYGECAHDAESYFIGTVSTTGAVWKMCEGVSIQDISELARAYAEMHGARLEHREEGDG